LEAAVAAAPCADFHAELGSLLFRACPSRQPSSTTWRSG
jgi:hypothetical protein